MIEKTETEKTLRAARKKLATMISDLGAVSNERVLQFAGTEKVSGEACQNPKVATNMHMYEGTLTEGRSFGGQHKDVGDTFTATRIEYRRLAQLGAVRECLNDKAQEACDAVIAAKEADVAAKATAAKSEKSAKSKK